MQPRPLLLPVALTTATLSACADIACTRGADGCAIPSPCVELSYTCDAGSSEVRVIASADEGPGGIAALASPGDVLLGNDQVVAVIDAIDHPHYLAPTGGTLIDLARRGADDDSLRQVLQAVGLLPDDTVAYTDLRIVDDGPVKAVQVSGELVGRPGVKVATRYEVRPCEPGIRVRTELYHGGTDPLPMILADGWYLGDRGHVPFTPSPGAGFTHPSFGLSTVTDALVDVPYLVTGAHPLPGASYASLACNRLLSDGLHSDIISVMGAPTRVIAPRDSEIYERFVAVSSGPSVAGAADLALEARRQLFGSPYTTLSGRLVSTDGAPFGWPARAQLVIAEGAEADGREARRPWTHVVPEADGTWSVRVPTGRTYTLEVEAFGQLVTTAEVAVADVPIAAPDVPVPDVGQLRLTGPGTDLLVFVHPSTEVEADALDGRFLGTFEHCAPLLGHPHGASPACDRVLLRDPVDVLVPPGRYDLHAVRGPFSTLARAVEVEVRPGETTEATLAPALVDALPDGWVSGDFHVHGAASFDSGFGDEERVRTFAAAAIDVVASTEHDVVSDLTGALAATGLTDTVRVLQGTEATGHILFPLYDATTNPKVIGHWNLFPVPYDPQAPYRGAPWDELAEPGVLFERAIARGWDPATGVAQLNHPWGGFQFGRDYGWAETIALDLTQDLPTAYDGSGASLFLRVPPGASTSNAAYHTQEVMNGSANAVYAAYRAVWFYLLEQGLLRGGTANSDTHSLTENVLGFPRTLVRVDAPGDAAFLAAVRDGRMIGTNGPLLDVAVEDGATASRPSLTPFTPSGAATLTIRVASMPWVPLSEVRVVVNGAVVRTETLAQGDEDELGADLIERADLRIPLSELLPAGQDAWIVVEAGAPRVANADLDCDGMPDTGDTNGDGVIDWRDVDGLDEDPEEACLSTVGPLAEPQPPPRGARGYAFSVVVPRGHPHAFSNPLVIDADGDGWRR